LEETEHALARTNHEDLDLVLFGRRRRVEYLPLPVTIWRVNTIKEDCVQVGIESQITVCALNDCHSAGLASVQAALGVPAAIPSGNRVCEDAHHLAKQLPVEGEREAQREWHGDHELSQRHVGQNALCEVESSLAHTSAQTARAHCTRLARERHSIVLVAGVVVKMRKAPRENSAVEKLV
jgi:hypothetical protein